MAWLSAVPTETKPKGGKKAAKEISRGECFKAVDFEPPFPDVEYCDVLITYLGELGVCKPGPNGNIPLEWIDINEWLKGTQRSLLPCLCMILIKLSRHYVLTLSKSTHPNQKAPYTPEGDKDLAFSYRKARGVVLNG